MPVNSKEHPMTSVGLVPVSSPASSASQQSWRIRWQHVRELVSGALILAIWLALWSWMTFGVAAPLGRLELEDAISSGPAVADLRS
jgi:hypothetical protein